MHPVLLRRVLQEPTVKSKSIFRPAAFASFVLSRIAGYLAKDGTKDLIDARRMLRIALDDEKKHRWIDPQHNILRISESARNRRNQRGGFLLHSLLQRNSAQHD